MNAIKMIRRCALRQPDNPSYGTATAQGEIATDRTPWGVRAYAGGGGRFIYPAFCFKEDPLSRPDTTSGSSPVPTLSEEMFGQIADHLRERVSQIWSEYANNQAQPRAVFHDQLFRADGAVLFYQEP